jgi:hypothetical protein
MPTHARQGLKRQFLLTLRNEQVTTGRLVQVVVVGLGQGRPSPQLLRPIIKM